MDTPVTDLALDALRQERDELRAHGEALSYHRRVLQAQLDMVQGEGELVDVLADTDTGEGGTRGASRALATSVPDVDVPPLPDLDGLDESARAALADRLATQEGAVSAERRTVLARHDELQAELVRRYRETGVDVADLTRGGG